MITLLALSALAQDPEPVAPVDDGASVRQLVWAQPFTLAKPARHTMSAEAAEYTRGMLIELRVDPQLMVPSQAYEPVLYVGPTPVRKLNWDPDGGCAVVLVPGEPDLTQTPVFFGSLELPERVDAERGQQELAAARAQGVTPFADPDVKKAIRTTLPLADLSAVMELGQTRVESSCRPTPPSDDANSY